MKPNKIYENLIEIADKLGIKIILDKGNFKGGYCLLEKEKIIVINKLKPIENRIKSLAQVFAKWDTSNIHMLPIIRQIIDSESN